MENILSNANDADSGFEDSHLIDDDIISAYEAELDELEIDDDFSEDEE